MKGRIFIPILAAVLFPATTFAATQIWVASGAVIQTQPNFTGTPAAIPGAATCLLDSSGASALATVQAAPNNGITTAATPDANGNCNGATFEGVATPTPTATPAPNPTIALAAGAGTGASFALVSGSNLQRGIINLTAGTSSSAGSIMTVTFPGGSPYIQIQAIGDNATAVGIGLRTLTSTVATVGARGAMTAGQIYQIGYVLVP